MADGKGCKCAAYDESECACDADWTPQELVDARAEIARLRLTAAERKAVEWYGAYGAGDHAATLRSLLDRLCGTEHAGSAAAQPSAASAGYAIYERDKR